MIANYIFFNMLSKGEYIMNVQSSAYSEARHHIVSSDHGSP